MYDLNVINSTDDIDKLWHSPISFDRLDTYEKFDMVYRRLFYDACSCWDLKDVISHPIKFKFYHDDKETYQLSIPKLLCNMNVWRLLIELNEVRKFYLNIEIKPLDKNFMCRGMMTEDIRSGMTSKAIKILESYGVTFERRCELLKDQISLFQELAIEFSCMDKLSILTLENIYLNEYRTNPKMKELSQLVVDPNLQTIDVEIFMREKFKELEEVLAVTGNNPLYNILRTGRHIKPKQFQELYLGFGQIPDVSGLVIPYTMTGNGFRTGYNEPKSYFIAATGAKLAAIMNKMYMGDAGYLSRNLILLSRTITLSKDVFNCGTEHFLKLKISSSTFLHRLENKWFKRHLSDVDLEIMTYSKYKHLIGETIYIRSLATCALGDEVCSVCYGRDVKLVSDLPGMAVYNTEVYSEPVSQNILSTKHLLFTSAKRVILSDNFNKYFKLYSGDIYLFDNNDNVNIDNYPNLHIAIPVENISFINENDTDEYNTSGNLITSPFYVYDSETKKLDEITIDNVEGIHVESNFSNLMKLVNIRDKDKEKKKYYSIPFTVISEKLENRIMTVDIKNHGLTDNLYKIMKLLRNASKYDCYHTLAQDFFEILIESDINCRHVQAEIIINRLIRDANNTYERPKFHQSDIGEYTILTLNKAIRNTKAPTTGLSFQNLRSQLLSDALYDEKKESGYLDPMYAEKIHTNILNKVANKIRMEDLVNNVQE